MKARVLMYDVIRQTCMMCATLFMILCSEVSENTFFPISLTIVLCTVVLSVL